MLHAFRIEEGRLRHVDPTHQLDQAQWLDLYGATAEERAEVEELYRHALPGSEDIEEIEASSRAYEDQMGLHLRSLFLYRADGRPRNASVGFTLREDRLLSVHDRDIPAFRLLRMRARRFTGWARSPQGILVSVFEIKIDDLADMLEEIYAGLDRISGTVLEDESADMEAAIDELARFEDINGKVRLCLMDTQRALTFLQRRGGLNDDDSRRVRELLQDTESLLPHNSFLFDKVNFLMDAALGFINLEQSQIIKIFSIAAVVFLPPTLVASIYGMNFAHMPELDWLLGYPMALGLMVVAGVAPYLYFKFKGWL
ncbi:magnesium/cobalt transporter CorA [Ectothiorhodospiraceae bacterium WFHF3C12]|nr:magnesium/cobalt transporter CorA [Ectothiorhodospiraceae bacterium WFHF3C12]